ncbi:hypothetical protein [Ancylobacter defluvii]|uniref:Uncharacterized protein n=1 Tax=Ancylobacter defluvii TaxID=1282440 RepID=A0A9W6NCJ2_9HYPH|nr:hypothetical protein [Ancylobacter defluvii]MBS7588238.1 hypothetical protein [Ancylobacter defluvii]GLK86634.1 hypothetical protein GCM10017653_47040 [Ancylobacter defluvii]
MIEITREAILKGQGRMRLHLNYGGGRGGYAYEHLVFPRLGWIDKHGRWKDGQPLREWTVDGDIVGEGEIGLEAAIVALGKPVILLDGERKALALIPADFDDYGEVRLRVGAAFEEDGSDERKQRISGSIMIEALRAKGLVEFGREELPPGIVPFEHLNFKTTIRRRADG